MELLPEFDMPAPETLPEGQAIEKAKTVCEAIVEGVEGGLCLGFYLLDLLLDVGDRITNFASEAAIRIVLIGLGDHARDRQNQLFIGVAIFNIEYGGAFSARVVTDLAQYWKRIALATSGGLRAFSLEDWPQY